jgi:uncharacterized membrane protein
MHLATVLAVVTVFCAGILAGALVVIDYGVGHALAAIRDEQAHIQVRQALIRRLRVLVPTIFVPTILVGLALTLLAGSDPGFGLRVAGLLDVLACFVLTLLGTAPINATVLTWQPSAPPAQWQTLVRRWERFDTARTCAAITAFALFLLAMALKLAAQ